LRHNLSSHATHSLLFFTLHVNDDHVFSILGRFDSGIQLPNFGCNNTQN
jgi:hypothetical protein